MTNVEGISSKINSKIKIINELQTRCQVASIDQLSLAYQKVVENFEFGSLQILSDYYFLSTDSPADKKKKADLLNQYIRFIIRENVVSRLNSIYAHLKNIVLQYEARTPELSKLLFQYEEIKLKIVPRESRGYECSICDEQMSFISRESILECPKCFAQMDAKGMMLSEDQANIADRNHRSNQYQSRKHGKAWLDALQGLESKEIPKYVITHVRDCMRKDRIIDMSKATCSTIRGYLSKMPKTSKYNQHIPKIRKLVTGIEPPQLTEAETDLFYEYFGRVINIYNSTKKKVNCPYCPYFIYKILEHMLSDPESEDRRNRFFSYIHLQLPNTLNEQDRVWEQICKQIPEFEYKPTIRRL